MAISLKHLEAFVAVADQLSFRRAAERLNTTQPNISARIAALEARLGVVLMERDAGSVRLTPKGETLLTHARRVIGEVDGMIAAAADNSLYEGVIRLGVTEMIAQSWLGDFLKALKAEFPNLIVELTVDFSVNISAGLFSRSLDLAFQSGPFDRPASGALPLSEYPMIWAASPGLGVPDRELTLDDLTRHPLLISARGTEPFIELTRHLAERGAPRARTAPSTSLSAVRQMAVDGLGLACLPEEMAAAALAKGALREVDYPWRPRPLRFSARWDEDRAPSFIRRVAEIASDIAAARAGG